MDGTHIALFPALIFNISRKPLFLHTGGGGGGATCALKAAPGAERRRRGSQSAASTHSHGTRQWG